MLHKLCSLVPRPSATSFLFAYVTFEPLSDKLAEGLVGWYHSYVIYKKSGHDYDVGGHDFMYNGYVPEVHGLMAGFLASYCWLLRYRGGPLEASGMELLVVRLE